MVYFQELPRLLEDCRCNDSHSSDAEVKPAQALTLIIGPAALHSCLPSILMLLGPLRAVPVHNGWQPLAGARVPVVLHMRHIQKGKRSCIIGGQYAEIFPVAWTNIQANLALLYRPVDKS